MVIKYATKEKEAVKAVVKQAPISEDAVIVDRIAELTKLLAKVDPRVKELTDLKKKLRESDKVKAAAVDAEVRFVGTAFDVTFSKCAHSRTIKDMKLAKKALGTEVFMEVATVTLGDIDKYVANNDQKDFIIEADDGARTFKLVPKTTD